jgi:hypothetical protein
MRIVVSDEARELIAERGGRLYVSMSRARCCGGARTLVAKTDLKTTAEFDSLGAAAGFELFFPRTLGPLPEELHIEARRFPRRVEAYWNGCAWVV